MVEARGVESTSPHFNDIAKISVFSTNFHITYITNFFKNLIQSEKIYGNLDEFHSSKPYTKPAIITDNQSYNPQFSLFPDEL